jgi:hypothetical protein
MSETKQPEKLPYPNDPLRVDPKIKHSISSSGVFIYVDTCDHCRRYSDYYHACNIRSEQNRNEVSLRGVKTPMSVNAGYKCKYWKKA